MLEINGIKEITKVTFPINLKLIKEYQQPGPSLMAKYGYYM